MKELDSIVGVKRLLSEKAINLFSDEKFDLNEKLFSFKFITSEILEISLTSQTLYTF